MVEKAAKNTWQVDNRKLEKTQTHQDFHLSNFLSLKKVFLCQLGYNYATGVINDPVEFAIFAYVDTWEGLGGWVGWV